MLNLPPANVGVAGQKHSANNPCVMSASKCSWVMRKSEDAATVSLFSTNSWFQPKRLYLWKENGRRRRKGGGGLLRTAWNQVPFAQSDILSAADP